MAMALARCPLSTPLEALPAKPGQELEREGLWCFLGPVRPSRGRIPSVVGRTMPRPRAQDQRSWERMWCDVVRSQAMAAIPARRWCPFCC